VKPPTIANRNRNSSAPHIFLSGSVIIGTLVFLLFFTSPPSFAATITYEYDALNRLQTVNYGNGYPEAYIYDNVGNRTSFTIGDTTSPTGGIDSTNITLSDGNATISGTASDLGSGIYTIEISIDGGEWITLSNATNWSYAWPAALGSHDISVRITDYGWNTYWFSTGITVSLQTFTVSVSKSGNGTGSATSSPSGITCGSVCSASYTDGTQVTLTASPDYYCLFSGWSGCDSVNGNTCTITMTGNRNPLACFTYNSCGTSPVRIVRTGQVYSTLQAAYDAAQTGDTIQVQASLLSGSLTANRDISITIAGGYTCDFSSNSGNVTGVQGHIQTTPSGGTLTVRNIIITN
jgi:hypothetical protein